jgi:hypothetical protein
MTKRCSILYIVVLNTRTTCELQKKVRYDMLSTVLFLFAFLFRSVPVSVDPAFWIRIQNSELRICPRFQIGTGTILSKI